MIQHRPGIRNDANLGAKIELRCRCCGNLGAAKRAGDAAGVVDLKEGMYAGPAEDMLAGELERDDIIRAFVGGEVVKAVGLVAYGAFMAWVREDYFEIGSWKSFDEVEAFC